MSLHRGVVRANIWFASLSDEDLAQISEWLEVRSAEPAQRVLLEGDSGYSFFIQEVADARRDSGLRRTER